MQTIFSTSGVRAKDRFRKWREICEDRLVPMEQNSIGNTPFHALIEGISIGGLEFTKFSLRDLRASTTSQTIRHQNNKSDHVFVSIVLSGSVCSGQNDRSTTDKPGDLSIRDTNTPWTIEHNGHSEVLAIAVARDRLESMLGSARIFAGLTVESHLPVATLARSFLCNLLPLGDQLTPDAAERMASVGIDLIVASLAERMARETPKALQGTLIVQRAKAYVAANLSDPGLDPSQVAAAVGVSLRHLQELFRDHEQSIAAWIWRQRLEKAAQRLSDPACLHLQLGELAYGCGFTDQSHFSHRFREHYGMSPRDYRHAALTPTSVR